MGSPHLKAQDTTACTPEKPCKALVIRDCISSIPDTLPLDTNISRFYLPPVYLNNVLFPAITGSSGRPTLDLYYRFKTPSEGYIFRNPYTDYETNIHNLELIRSDVPYSEWYYLIGANRNQIFRAVYAQDVGKGLNFGVDVKFINHLGAYRHEHAKTNNASLYAQYRAQKLPLQSQIFLFFNGITHEENGGISDPSYFEDTVKINRELAPIWLSSAVNSHRSTEVVSVTDWRFGKPAGKLSITGKPDSVAVSGETTIGQILTLDLRAKREWFIYRDEDPFNPWYTLTRYDTIVTFDSLWYGSLQADFSYRVQLKQFASLSVGIKALAYRYYDTLNPAGSGNAWSPYATLCFKPFRGLMGEAEISASSDQAFGWRHLLSANIQWNPSEWVFGASVREWSAYPYRQDMTYASNHFVWNQSMTNTRYLQGKAFLQLRGKYPVDLSMSATRITNIIYYNQQALPNQYPGDIWLLQLLASTSGEAGLMVYDAKVGLQKSLDEASILRVPLLLGEAMAGLRFRLFKGKISAIGGVVVHARTAAYTDQWMPATRVFYHTTLYETGGYVWADPFVTFVLKKTRFMLKYEHASAWLAGFGQYSVPGYPMTDPAIKFAVAWRFMD